MFLVSSHLISRGGGGRILPLLPKFLPQASISVRSFSGLGQDFDPKKDYWKVLNVRPGVSEKEIKIAYYKMAQKYHPDKTGGKTVE